MYMVDGVTGDARLDFSRTNWEKFSRAAISNTHISDLKSSRHRQMCRPASQCNALCNDRNYPEETAFSPQASVDKRLTMRTCTGEQGRSRTKTPLAQKGK